MNNKNLILLDLGDLIREMFRVFKKRCKEHVADENIISTGQLTVLHFINENENDVIQKDIAECLGKDKSSILRNIDTLEKFDLVRRVSDKNDRRKNFLMITKKGNSILNQYKTIGSEILVELQENIDPSDVKIFREVLNKLKTNAEKI